MSKKIVTNLRIDEVDWLRLKTIAAESNMSINEYVNRVIDLSISKASLVLPKKTKKNKKNFYDLMIELSKKKSEPGKFELSEEDKIIYGI